MRRCARAPRPHRLHFLIVQKFQSRWRGHFGFERLRARIPRDPPRRPPCRRSRNLPLPLRSFAHQPPAAPAPPEWAAAQRERCSRPRSRTGAVSVFPQFLPPGRRTAPEFSGAVEERAAIPLAFAICELFPSREYLRSYHTRLQPLNAFAPRLARTGERVERAAALSNVSMHPGKLLLGASRYC